MCSRSTCWSGLPATDSLPATSTRGFGSAWTRCATSRGLSGWGGGGRPPRRRWGARWGGGPRGGGNAALEALVSPVGGGPSRLQCRSCGQADLRQVLDLGRVPLANALLTSEQLNEPEDRFPLELYFCPQCALVQIGETVPPERLFRDYAYASSFSDTMVEHARTLVGALIGRRGLGPESLVIEVASNDGYLLQFYQQRGVPVLGIEPAANIAELAIKTKGIPTLVEFFDEELAKRLAAEGKLADVIHAHNVFAHVPDPNRFAGGIKRLLKPRGVAVVEAPYLHDLIDKLEFD